MDKCGARISQQLALLNKTATFYRFNGDACARGNDTNLTIDDCYAELHDAPVFYLYYSPENLTPYFEIVYRRQAEIAGDAGYFQRCDVAEAMR